MRRVQVIDVEDAVRITGLSAAEINDARNNGKVIVITTDQANSGTGEECPMVGTRSAAKLAGLSESTIRNYADEGKILCIINPHNGFRKHWVTDAAKLRPTR
jgi:hypothetical protein